MSEVDKMFSPFAFSLVDSAFDPANVCLPESELRVHMESKCVQRQTDREREREGGKYCATADDAESK